MTRSERQDAPSTADYLALDDRALLGQCEVDVYRASGPGGQKRNKIESAVRCAPSADRRDRQGGGEPLAA